MNAKNQKAGTNRRITAGMPPAPVQVLNVIAHSENFPIVHLIVVPQLVPITEMKAVETNQ